METVSLIVEKSKRSNRPGPACKTLAKQREHPATIAGPSGLSKRMAEIPLFRLSKKRMEDPLSGAETKLMDSDKEEAELWAPVTPIDPKT